MRGDGHLCNNLWGILILVSPEQSTQPSGQDQGTFKTGKCFSLPNNSDLHPGLVRIWCSMN